MMGEGIQMSLESGQKSIGLPDISQFSSLAVQFTSQFKTSSQTGNKGWWQGLGMAMGTVWAVQVGSGRVWVVMGVVWDRQWWLRGLCGWVVAGYGWGGGGGCGGGGGDGSGRVMGAAWATWMDGGVWWWCEAIDDSGGGGGWSPL
ncbi:hypothetical protein K439DRAFT_1612847 [Ramaria rubella]|nr:hypothetical protein K439DRAFT_1612847 [Ramaria rubella]